MSANPTSLPTSLPIDLSVLNDPLVQKIVAGAAGLILLVILLRILGGWRAGIAERRRRAEIRKSFDAVRMQQEELRKLGEQVVATSSTSRIAGFALVRQVETVFSEPQRSSGAAVEMVKALAAQKGANAIINLKTEQMASGKWTASGDAVLVRPFGGGGEPGGGPKKPEKPPGGHSK